MKYYLLVFSGIYMVAVIVFGILTTLLNIPNSGGVPTLLAAGFLTAWHFVNKEKRIPDDQEKIQLIWGSIACTFIVSALLVIIFVLATEFGEIIIASIKIVPLWLLLVVTTVMVFIEYAIFYMAYGWFAKKCQEELHKKSRRR